MHLSASYTTGPSAVLVKAPTGQTEAQVGSLQCMHSFRLKRSPKTRIVVSLWADNFSSFAILSLYANPHLAAQAFSHSRQPTQRVLSYRMALAISLSP